MLELYYMIDLSRYVSDAYFCYMTGKYNKAIKKYEKIGKKMTAYEMRLLAHIKEIKDKEGQVKVIPENLRTFETARKYKKSPRKLISL